MSGTKENVSFENTMNHKGRHPRGWASRPRFNAPTFIEVTLALQKLLALHRAGLPLVETLYVAAGASSSGFSGSSSDSSSDVTAAQVSGANARMWWAIAKEIQGGQTLAFALAPWQTYLGPATVYLFVWGAEAGALVHCLAYAIRLRQRQIELQQRWQKLLIYPKVVAAAVLGMSALMLFWLIPIFAPLLQQSGTELPGLTRALIRASTWLTQLKLTSVLWGEVGSLGLLGLLGLISIALLGVFGSRRLDRPKRDIQGRRIFSAAIAVLPFIGPIYVLTYCARWAHGLDTLVRAGVSIYQALQILAVTIPHRPIQQLNATLLSDLESGREWAYAIARQGYLPHWMRALLATSQDSATLQAVLPQIDAVLEQEIEYQKSRYTRYAEPFLLALLGVFILLLLGAIYIPLFSLGRAL